MCLCVVCQVKRSALLHQEAGAPCLRLLRPGSPLGLTSFFPPAQPEPTPHAAESVGEGLFQRNSRIKASEAKPNRMARWRWA